MNIIFQDVAVEVFLSEYHIISKSFGIFAQFISPLRWLSFLLIEWIHSVGNHFISRRPFGATAF